ncbi:MAG TPA: polyprenyl synthetase family protein, partial [Thermodesulfobacteriota bacterium]|nr:polyprenyl synthetase family protein [Thermodesulfobacteriota bacterium]
TKERIVSIIKDPNREEKDLRYVMAVVRDSGIEYTAGRAAEYIGIAKDCLSPFSSSPEKEALLAVADYTIKRKQ